MMAAKPGLPSRSSAREVDAFLRKAARVPALSQTKGRLVFAIDATMSRQPSWDRAMAIQADMFTVAGEIGGLAVQLVYFRGVGEFHRSEWVTTPAALRGRMTGVACRGGLTQVNRVLQHTIAEAAREKVGALVYVGDCFEEDPAVAAEHAGRLALLGVPAFMFHEGGNPTASAVFQEIARLSGGVYAAFDAGAARRLRELLTAAAVYAAGGLSALDDYGARVGGEALRIAHALGRKR
jgi:hypothetical protein